MTDGTCATNLIGHRCKNVTGSSFDPYPWSTSAYPVGSFTAKVIAQVGGLSAQSQTGVNFSAPSSATADIQANGMDSDGSCGADCITVAAGSNVNITWSSTNATSCSISPTGWTGTSGNQNQTAVARTYTETCLPGPATDSITVQVAAPTNFTLTVIKAGQGTVKGTSVPPQTEIDCGPTCVLPYTENTEVILDATPAAGRIFTGWGGDCTGTPRTSDCTVIMNTNRSVIANFAIDPTYKEF
jgi:hypothetical protein